MHILSMVLPFVISGIGANNCLWTHSPDQFIHCNSVEEPNNLDKNLRSSNSRRVIWLASEGTDRRKLDCALAEAGLDVIARLPDTPYDPLESRRTWIVDERTGEEILRDLPDNIQSFNPVYLKQFEEDQDYTLKVKERRLLTKCYLPDISRSALPTACTKYIELQREKDRRQELIQFHLKHDLPLWPDSKTPNIDIKRYLLNQLPRHYRSYFGREFEDNFKEYPSRIGTNFLLWSQIDAAVDRLAGIVNVTKSEPDRKTRALERARLDPRLGCDDLDGFLAIQ